MGEWSIAGKGILTPDKFVKKASLLVSDGIIDKIDGRSSFSIEVDGIIVPGLINSHDHLLGTYHPKVGNGPMKTGFHGIMTLKVHQYMKNASR